MAKSKGELEEPGDDLITTLQNRINDLEADLKAEKESRAAAPKFEKGQFDAEIANLKTEIAEFKREVAAAKVEKKISKIDAPAEDDGFEGSIGSGLRALCVFEE